MRKYVLRLAFCLAIVIGPLIGMIATKTTPQLGLDLQGGISVVLGPKEGQKTNSDALDKAVDIIRNRVDALGVAEPEISRQGSNIIVDLPGVKNRERARALVGRTAELRFRPVLQLLPDENVAVTTTTSTAPGATTTTVAGATTTTVAGATTTTAKAGGATSTTKQGGRIAGAAEATTTTAAGGTTTTTAAGSTTTTTALSGKIPTSKDDDPTQIVVLPLADAEKKGSQIKRLQLGPAELTGKAVSSATANFENKWVVNVKFNSQGGKDFDALAAKYVGRQIAIVLDGVVQSFPTIETTQFNGKAQISGSFTQKSARDLATVLRYGALPIALEERQLATVSPTLGRDQLRSGVAAGLIGLGLVAIYMLLYYRLLGLVIVAGLVVASAALYVVTAYMSEANGLTLTLAGVTGIIVSVGITVDSYVVYFERLKDEVRSGKTIRSSVDRGFARSFRTILAADFVSLIGAVLLYWQTVGSVRGFAFFLGLSTVLDIFVSYFFMHPLVTILARSPRFSKARWLSLSTGLGVKGGDGVKIKETLSDIFNERTNFDFIGPRRKFFAASLAAMTIGVIFLVVNGLNLGIDFKGGTSWQFEKRTGSISTSDLRSDLSDVGLDDVKVLVLNGDEARVQSHRASREEQAKVAEALAKYGDIDVEDVSISDVGPTWGEEVSRKAVKALVFFFIAIGLYLSLRFEPKMAIAAVAAVIHDVLITVGAYAVTGFEVTPATVIAFLTILGFSLYDTVVVFDKIKENSDGLPASARTTYSGIVNRSMNEVLMRSLNTSFVAVLPVMSLLFVGAYAFGALTIKDFSLALFIGLLTGAYSSIFVATPVLAALKEREPRYKAMRQRMEAGTQAGKGSKDAFGHATTLEGAVAGDGDQGAEKVSAKAEVGAATAARRPPPGPRRVPKRPPPKRRKR